MVDVSPCVGTQYTCGSGGTGCTHGEGRHVVCCVSGGWRWDLRGGEGRLLVLDAGWLMGGLHVCDVRHVV